MKLTEKYRPTKYDELIGDVETIKGLETFVKNSFPVILCGDPGIGKTTSVYVIANELGYFVSESNMSDARTSGDLHKLGQELKTNKFVPTLFLLDEIDGVSNQSLLLDVIKDSKHPIMMTANDKYKLSPSLKKYCKFFELKNPNPSEVVALVKRIAKSENITNISFRSISSDVRASINAAFRNGCSYDDDSNDFNDTSLAFKENVVSSVDPIWLLDNVNNFYHGIDVYDTIKKISYIVDTMDPIFITTFKKAKSGTPSYPNFIRRKS